jgi:hypothetical protein
MQPLTLWACSCRQDQTPEHPGIDRMKLLELGTPQVMWLRNAQIDDLRFMILILALAAAAGGGGSRAVPSSNLKW